MKTFLIISTLVPSLVFAADGAHGDHGVPWGLIGQQALNLSLLLILLTVLLRKKISQHFAERKVQYKQLIERAEEAKVAAEKSKREITERLQKLESNADNSIHKARSEAEELKKKIIAEAETLSARLEEEAKRTAEFELERAKLKLRNSLMEEAFKVARTNLESEVSSGEQQRLKAEFVDRIQVVQ